MLVDEDTYAGGMRRTQSGMSTHSSMRTHTVDDDTYARRMRTHIVV